jgi:hypothetical protein
LEADRRHTTTGFECRKSCSKSCLDLAELVVDLDADRLKSAGGDMYVARPGSPRDGRLDGRGQVAGGAERAPHHDELSDPPGPALFAEFAEDSLELRYLVVVDDPRGGELRPGVHPHVERPVGAEAETAHRVVDLVAGDAEVEEDQVGWDESVVGGNLAKLGESTLYDDCAGTESRQRLLAGLDRVGISIDPQEPAARRDPLQDLAGMARLPERAVDSDRPRPGLEQLYYVL